MANNRKLPISEELADEMAEKVIEILGKTPLLGRIRRSHILSAVLAAAGFALFIVGVEKIFADLSGPLSVILGLGLMALAGALFQTLAK